MNNQIEKRKKKDVKHKQNRQKSGSHVDFTRVLVIIISFLIGALIRLLILSLLLSIYSLNSKI